MRIDNETEIERLFYSADELMSQNEYAEAKEVLIELLAEDPTYALAHNMIGWIYNHQLLNYTKAEQHFKLSIKYGNGVVEGYRNYAFLLLDMNKYAELRAFVDSNINLVGIDKAYFLALKAITFEVESRYYIALKLLNEAKQYALNEDFINKIMIDKSRIERKMGKFARFAALF